MMARNIIEFLIAILGFGVSPAPAVVPIQAPQTITMIATGDVIPARVVNYKTMVQYKDPLWPWRKTADFLSEGDITFINLETPLFDECLPVRSETMVFCGSNGHLAGLLYGGVDVASLANNHTRNYGNDGVTKTKNLLENAGIAVTGVDGPIYKTTSDTKLAFLGYNDIEAKLDTDKMVAEIKEARKNADILVVAIHWGAEYHSLPDDRQRYLAHLIIDSGADVIIGNHPHWIQPTENYKGKFITYAHGNFIFDQEWSEKTKLGVVGKYTFTDKKLTGVEFFPVKIVDYGQPYFLEGAEKDKILREMKENGEKLKSTTSE